VKVRTYGSWQYRYQESFPNKGEGAFRIAKKKEGHSGKKKKPFPESPKCTKLRVGAFKSLDFHNGGGRGGNRKRNVFRVRDCSQPGFAGSMVGHFLKRKRRLFRKINIRTLQGQFLERR